MPQYVTDHLHDWLHLVHEGMTEMERSKRNSEKDGDARRREDRVIEDVLENDKGVVAVEVQENSVGRVNARGRVVR